MANLEHATSPKTRQDPRNLDHPLVRARRGVQPAQWLLTLPGGETEGDLVVELTDALELGSRDKLVQERRPRERSIRQPPECPLPRFGVGQSPKHQQKRAVNEAVYALMEGVAEPEAIDTVARLGFAHRSARWRSPT